MAILRGDDLSPTAMDAYELVKSFVPAEIPEVRTLLQGLAIPLAMFMDVTLYILVQQAYCL